MLSEILDKLNALPQDEKDQLIRETMEATASLKWIPNPGPQSKAFFSKASILLYGGAAYGGKSQLVLGLASTVHERSLIMRRQYGDLSHLTDEACRIQGTRDGFNASPPPRFRIPASNKFPNGQLIEFGGAKDVGSEQAFQGNPHDLLAFDEAVQFAESQIRFLLTWNRSTTQGRSRCVLASNPPIHAEGQWIIGMFRPWLDVTHDNPAKDGELRWYCRTPDGDEIEVDDNSPKEWDGQIFHPASRTFIQARADDNPAYDLEYKSKLDSLPEPYRSAMRDGNFMAARQDSVRQLIPTQWIREAQQRWTVAPPKGIPMCSIGVDVAAGGEDNTVLAVRHDGWFAPLIQVPGKQTPSGKEIAGLIFQHRRDGALVVLDMGGGFGQSPLEHLQENSIKVMPYKGRATTSQKSLEGFHFASVRACAYWRLREALDPSQRGGSSISLPNDPELISDLTTLEFDIERNGIKISTKDDVKDILGRSPDKGDAVAMAWYGGDKNMGPPDEWAKHLSDRGNKRRPSVIRKILGNGRRSPVH